MNLNLAVLIPSSVGAYIVGGLGAFAMLARLNIRWNTKYHNKAWFSADWAPLLIASFLWPLTLALSLVVIPCVLIALTVHKVGSTFPVKRLLFGKHFKEVV